LHLSSYVLLIHDLFIEKKIIDIILHERLYTLIHLGCMMLETIIVVSIEWSWYTIQSKYPSIWSNIKITRKNNAKKPYSLKDRARSEEYTHRENPLSLRSTHTGRGYSRLSKVNPLSPTPLEVWRYIELVSSCFPETSAHRLQLISRGTHPVLHDDPHSPLWRRGAGGEEYSSRDPPPQRISYYTINLTIIVFSTWFFYVSRYIDEALLIGRNQQKNLKDKGSLTYIN